MTDSRFQAFIERNRHVLIVAAAVSCFLVCLGDFVVPELLAEHYPGYDRLHQSESDLGASISPVAFWFTAWSLCMAALFNSFAVGVTLAYWPERRSLHPVSWLLILYAVGEGIGSGVFPYDVLNGGLTWTGQVHAVFSVIGSAALYLLPLAWLRWPPAQGPRLRSVSVAVLAIGLLLLALFGATKLGLLGHRGLWQRLFICTYYIYLVAIAVHMLVRRSPSSTAQAPISPP